MFLSAERNSVRCSEKTADFWKRRLRRVSAHISIFEKSQSDLFFCFVKRMECNNF